MGVQFTVTVDGEDQLIRSFNRLRAIPEDMTRVWNQVRPVFFAIEREQFRTEGAAGRSGKWKSLSSPYKEIKRKEFGDLPILQRTKALVRSLTGNTPDTISITGPSEAFFGTSLDRGRYHQRGNSRLPQRKVIDPSDSQLRDLQKAIQRGLVNIIRDDPGLEAIEVNF